MADELTDLLDTALYKEIASQAVYTAAQGKTDDPGARALMKELAEEELKHSQAIKRLKEAGVEVVDEHIIDRDFIVRSDREIYKRIEKQALELIKQYPQDKFLFESYLQKQKEENDFLENKFFGVTFLLRNN